MEASLDIDLLRTFHTVARLEKFRTAAEQLHKSPAAISVHIQRLETLAGGRLFERDNQSVALTPLGKRLLTSTAELLATHDRVMRDLHGTALSGRVVIGVPDEYAEHVIRDVLPAFCANWPNVVLEVRTAPSGALREQVARGKLDLALVVQPVADPRTSEPLAYTVPVWAGSRAFVVDPAIPLPLALYGKPCPYRAVIMETLAQTGRRWRIVLDSASSLAIKACVESGLGVSLLDRRSITPAMKLLDGLPAVGEHAVVLMRAPSDDVREAVDELERTFRRFFRW